MSIIRRIKETYALWSGLWDYVCHGQFGELDDLDEPLSLVAPGNIPSRRERQPIDLATLRPNMVIDDGNVRCKIVSYGENDFRIRILAINWDRLNTYMDLGETYSLLLCSDFDDYKVWEVDPDQMKRDTSQVLLAWEKNVGWTWDLDA